MKVLCAQRAVHTPPSSCESWIARSTAPSRRPSDACAAEACARLPSAPIPPLLDQWAPNIGTQAWTGQLQLEFLLTRSAGQQTLVVPRELRSGCFWDRHKLRSRISRGPAPPDAPSAARPPSPGVGSCPRLRRDDALRLPSPRVCSRSLTAPAGRPQEGEELRRCRRPGQKSTDVHHRRLSLFKLAAAFWKSRPLRPAHFLLGRRAGCR